MAGWSLWHHRRALAAADRRVQIVAGIVSLVLAAVLALGVPRVDVPAPDARTVYVAIDPVRRRVTLQPAVPDTWWLCDGEAGACVPVRSLREASAAVTRRSGR